MTCHSDTEWKLWKTVQRTQIHRNIRTHTHPYTQTNTNIRDICFHKLGHSPFLFSINCITVQKSNLPAIVTVCGSSSENIKSFHARGHMGILQIALEVQTFSSNIYRAERNGGRYHGWICELDNWRKALKYKTISKQVISDSLWGCTQLPVSARNMRNIASLLASIRWESGVEKEKKKTVRYICRESRFHGLHLAKH